MIPVTRKQRPSIPPLYGAVLAGGKSSRMGRPKALLRRDQESFLARGVRLLEGFCEETSVSVGTVWPPQGSSGHFFGVREYPLLYDAIPDGGPLGGISAALRAAPHAAWLIIAVDMPLLDEETLKRLVAARDPKGDGTAFRSPQTLAAEPLCTIWEPSAAPLVNDCLASDRRSVTRCLFNLNIKLIGLPDPRPLWNANTPEDIKTLRSVS